MKNIEPDWKFAKAVTVDITQSLQPPSLDDLYRQSLNSREVKRDLFQTAMNAALENLMSWERMVRAEGFEVEVLTDIHNGSPFPVFEGDKVRFIQAYGVRVHEPEEGETK